MMNRQAIVAGAVLLALSSAPFANVASAMPLADHLGIKNAAPANIEQVRWRGRGGGVGIGAAIIGGAILGGILAAPSYYGPGPYYAPPPGDPVAYCMRRFRSYDPSSGTYLGVDGYRHPCP
jgi:hypothetical protein